MIWSMFRRKPLPASSDLPEELVLQVRDMSITFRSFREGESGELVPRPMGWLFGKPSFLDDQPALERMLARAYPGLSDHQLARAIVMIERRCKAERRERGEGLLVRRRSPWMAETMAMQKHPADWEEQS